jgi:hypothetical protein
MTALTPRTVIIDGIRLDSFAYSITSRTGWESTPGLTGGNIRVPGRDGEIWQAKDYGTGQIVLDLFVQGTNADGAIPAGSTAEKTFRANIDALLATFSKRSGLLTVDKEIEDGSVRRNFAEVGSVIQPDYLDGNTVATFTVELIFPDPLWKSTTITTSTGTGSLSVFAGITAPISDAIITVAGPATNPRVTDTVSGAWIQYTGSVSGGSSWVVDCATFSSKIGGSSVIAATTFNPGPRFFSLTPSSSLIPSITLSSGSSISIAAARRFIA